MRYFLSGGDAAQLEAWAENGPSQTLRMGHLRAVDRSGAVPRTHHLRIERWNAVRDGWVVHFEEPLPPILASRLSPEPPPEQMWTEALRSMEAQVDARVDALTEDTPLSEALFRYHQTSRTDTGEVTVRSREVAWLILQAIQAETHGSPAHSFLGDPFEKVMGGMAGQLAGTTMKGCSSAQPLRESQLPLGVKPRWLVAEERARELLEALGRQANIVGPVPAEWLGELMELNEYLSLRAEHKRTQVVQRFDPPLGPGGS